MKRQIVQIATHYNDSHKRSVIIALAHDGSLWWGAKSGDGIVTAEDKFEWKRIQDLPDDTSNLGKVAL